jgi:hypothetical protein
VETFVVQIWARVDGADATRTNLRGFVEHVGSRRPAPFQGSGELLAFFETQQEPEPRTAARAIRTTTKREEIP